MTDTPAESTAEDVAREYVRRYILIERGLPDDEARRRVALFMEYREQINRLDATDTRALLQHLAWVLSRIVQERASETGRSGVDQFDHDLAIITAGRGMRDMEQWLDQQDDQDGDEGPEVPNP